MKKTPINHVSDTAIWVATYRAMETDRSDALFRDPLAKVLVGERGHEIAAKMKGSEFTQWAVVLRTCIIDDYIRFALERGVDTVLNLGAGLDTRPYRMDLPKSLRWIEVDHPQIIELKNDRLKNETPHCRLERVVMDLSDETKRDEFFSKIESESKKVLIITEGVVPYLSNDQAASLASALNHHAHFDYWITDYFSAEVMKYMHRHARRRQMQNAPFQFSPADWFEFFKSRGWNVKEMRYNADEAKRLKRPFPVKFFRFTRLFISKKRLETIRHMTGYALMQRSP